MASAEGATRARAKDKGMNFTQLCRLDFYCMFLFRTLVTATFSKNLQNYSLFIRNDCPILLKQRVKFMHLIENSVVFGLRCSSTNGMLEKKIKKKKVRGEDVKAESQKNATVIVSPCSCHSP